MECYRVMDDEQLKELARDLNDDPEKVRYGSESYARRTGQALFSFQPLDKAGLFNVTIELRSNSIVREFYLDDIDACEAFVTEAVCRLCEPGDDPNVMRRAFVHFLADERKNFSDCKDHLYLERMSEALPDKVEWLWPGRINADKLTMIVGEPGVGKSLVAMDIAARVSTGEAWPDEPPTARPREPGNVLLLSEMDDLADVIHPRLTAVGADLSRIHLLRTFIRGGEYRAKLLPFSVGGDLDMLEGCINKIGGCKLVIIDPLSLYVEGTHTRADITRLLGNLIEIAVKMRLAVLVISHFTQGGPSLFRYGSQANPRFVAAARSVWQIVRTHQDRDRRLLVPLKNNLGSDWLALPFRIRNCEDRGTARIQWDSMPLEVTTNVSAGRHNRIPNSYEVHRDRVFQWLHNELRNGERFAMEIQAAAAAAGIGKWSLRKALRQMGGTSRKGGTGLWVWSLAGQSALAPIEPSSPRVREQ